MENAVEALKIAFAVMMFVVALSLSISSLSQASSAVDAIINLNDRETEYTYVEPTSSNRTVGVETVVTSMYKAYQESFDIYFYKSNGDPLIIYKSKDELGNIIEMNSINGSDTFKNAQKAVEHLNQILGHPDNAAEEYKEQLNDEYEDGLYKFLSGKIFEEKLGEYYITQSENTPDANKVKKRVITYTVID